jgi:hypothetical protein
MSKLYNEIDVHTDRAPVWPDVIPPMTADEATKAAKRLWRYSMGTTFEGVVIITSGNRHNRIGWKGNRRAIWANPERGWKSFVHELSHWFDFIANGVSKHGKHHMRFERKLIKEVIERGYLDGKLKTAERAPPTVDEVKAKKLAALRARIKAWESKHRRAENALKKLRKQEKAMTK